MFVLRARLCGSGGTILVPRAFSLPVGKRPWERGWGDTSSACFRQSKSPFSNMAFKLPIMSSLKDPLKFHTANLPKFQWSELSDKPGEIGRGTYGSVFVATHGNGTVLEKVVVKTLIPSTCIDEKQKFFNVTQCHHPT